MKTEIEVQEYLKDKVYSSDEATFIIGFLCGKGLKPIIVCSSYSPPNSSEEFCTWFESETKEDNQDIISFEGKEYQFREGEEHDNCCFYGKKIDCNSFPCRNHERKDKKNGYFKLKTIQEEGRAKKLELIEGEFYYCEVHEKGKFIWIFQYRKGKEKTSHHYAICITESILTKNNYVYYDDRICNLRLATPEEKQNLISSVEKEKNKLWNESTKTFEDKPKDILVPESIKITDCKTDGYTLGLLFNNDIQILTYCKKSKAYLVGIKGLNAKYIPCKLIPTLFSEIKAGDIYIECGLNQLNPSCYHIKLCEKEYVKIDGKKDIQVCSDLPDKNQNVYKVVPVI